MNMAKVEDIKAGLAMAGVSAGIGVLLLIPAVWTSNSIINFFLTIIVGFFLAAAVLLGLMVVMELNKPDAP